MSGVPLRERVDEGCRSPRMAGALEGLRVVDFTQYAAGPFCTMMLGDLGAEVVKVEPPGGELLRGWGPYVEGTSAPFLQLNRNKKSITLNLKSEDGLRLARELVSRADILVENFRPGVMGGFGLSYEEVSSVRPEIIYCSVSGYGQSGPYAGRGAFDLVIQGLSGLIGVTGEPGRPPVKAGLPVVDLGAAAHAVVAILAAVIARARTGRGQMADIALLDAPLSWLVLLAAKYWATDEVQDRLGSAHPLSAPYQAFRTKDGYVTIAAGNQELWLATSRVLGLEHLADDARFRTNDDRARLQHELAPFIEAALLAHGTDEWVELFAAAGVPAGPVNTIDQVLEDEQVRHRGMIVRMERPAGDAVKVIGSPIKLSATPPVYRTPPPALGEHTAAVLGELGYTQRDIEGFRVRGVI